MYKTNRYSMPLYYIIGRTSFSRLYNVAYTFVVNEREENYALIIANLTIIFQINLPDQKPALFIINKE